MQIQMPQLRQRDRSKPVTKTITWQAICDRTRQVYGLKDRQAKPGTWEHYVEYVAFCILVTDEENHYVKQGYTVIYPPRDPKVDEIVKNISHYLKAYRDECLRHRSQKDGQHSGCAFAHPETE